MKTHRSNICLTVCILIFTLFSSACQSSGSSASGRMSVESAGTVSPAETESFSELLSGDETEQSDAGSGSLSTAANLYTYINDSNTAGIIELSYTFSDANNLPSGLDDNVIFLKGKDTVITKDEVIIYEKFFSEIGEDDPYQKASDYAKRRHALYAAAVKEGYAVSDNDVNAYLDDLRSMLKKALSDNEFSYMAPSLNPNTSYWDYEFWICRIDLPIKNYEEALKKSLIGAAGVQSVTGKKWEEELEKANDRLVQEQDYMSANAQCRTEAPWRAF